MRQKIQVKGLAVVLVCALSIAARAETPVVEWTRQLGTSVPDEAYGVSIDGSGYVYVTGSTCGDLDGHTTAGGADAFLFKYGADGTKRWGRLFGTADEEIGYGVSIDDSGNAYVTGSTRGGLDGNTEGGSTDMFLTKYDTNGVRQWTCQLGTVGWESGSGVSVDGSGNAYFTGWTDRSLDGHANAGHYDMFLAKYDTNGVKQWTRQLGTAASDFGTGVAIDDVGNAYVAGSTVGTFPGNTSSGYQDVFLAKYDTNGVKQWTRQLGTNSYDSGEGVSVDGSGNVYVTGTTSGGLHGNPSAGNRDAFLTKYDTNGIKQWTRQLGTASEDEAYGVSVDRNGNAYITGSTFGDLDGNINAGSWDAFLTKYDANGAKVWTCQLGTATDEDGLGVSVDGSGNAYVAGRTYGGLDGNTNAGDIDMFLVKVSVVPEPGSIAMLAGAALISLLYRRCKHV